jgi:hypothetical protein
MREDRKSAKKAGTELGQIARQTKKEDGDRQQDR